MAPARAPVDDPLRATLAAVAPGTALRDGLERILRGRTGALIVLGYDKTVESAVHRRLRARRRVHAPPGCASWRKMDGAIVVDQRLHQDPARRASSWCPTRRSPPTSPAPGTAPPTGSTSRPASRSSRSASRCASSRIYVDGQRYVLEDSTAILSRANQALATLERYKLRLDEVSGTLSALEIEDLVTVRDVSAVAQRLEMVRRIAAEIEEYVVELGTDGRLLTLQLDELIAGVEPDRELIVRDYLPAAAGRRARTVDDVLADLDAPRRTRAARPRRGRPRARLHRRRRGARRGRQPARLPAAGPGAAAARAGRRPAGRALRQPAEAARGQHRRPAGRRRRRRVAGPQRPRGPLPAGRVLDPRALRLSPAGRLAVAGAVRLADHPGGSPAYRPRPASAYIADPRWNTPQRAYQRFVTTNRTPPVTQASPVARTGTSSGGSVQARTTRAAASSRPSMPQTTLDTRHIRRNRGDRSHRLSQSAGHCSRPSASGREKVYARGRRPHRLTMNQTPVTPVSSAPLASSTRVLPDTRDTSTAPTSITVR